MFSSKNLKVVVCGNKSLTPRPPGRVPLGSNGGRAHEENPGFDGVHRSSETGKLKVESGGEVPPAGPVGAEGPHPLTAAATVTVGSVGVLWVFCVCFVFHGVRVGFGALVGVSGTGNWLVEL